MSKSRFGRFGQTTRHSKNSKSRPQQFRRGMFEELESRMVLSTTVGIGTGPVIVSFDDPNATASTVYTPKTTDPDVQVTLLHTTLIRMKVHTVNSDGSTGTQGEMDFLLLDDYAPVNIAHIESLISSGFYDGLTFHRIIQDFMIQGGDPTGTGGGGSGPNNTVVGHDDEFSTDLRFTTSGLLALANSGTDTNDCQFFITAAPYRDGDFQYTIIGKLVAGDDIRQAIANVPVEENSSGEDSKPVNPPIIDSVTIDTTSNEYGLVLLTSASGATAGETSNVSVATSDNSTVTLTGSDGTTGAVLAAVLATDTPSLQDRPAFIAQTMPDVHTTMNTPVTFPIAVVQGDPGVALAYGAEVGTSTTDLTCNSASDGSANATATPSGDILGVYDLVVGVWRNSSDTNSNTNYDEQHIALWVQPLAPTSLTLTTPAPGNQLSVENGLTFHVNGVTPGVTVDIFVDNGTTPIGSGIASGTSTSVDIVTTVPVIDGTHTFVAEQEYDYSDTTVGNRTIPAGVLYSAASPTTGKYVFDTPPTAVAVLDDVKKSDTGITFVVTYSNPGNTIAVGSLGDNNIQVNNVNGFQANAQFVIDTVSDNGATVQATYAFDAPDGTWDANDEVQYSLTMEPDQVRNAHGDYVATGILLVFNPLDLTDLTVTVDKASDQADPALTSPINFIASFNKTVADFTASGVTISGTAGATTAIVTPVSGSNGASYTIVISGMTQDGTVTVSLAAGVAHDAAGNPNDASTSTNSDNTVTFEGSPNGVTINQATGQADPTTASTIHFTVVFDIAVTDFTASDVTLGGTVLGNLVATITATDTTTYDVAVTGMASSGTVIASIPAGVAHDPLGVGNAASTSTDNTVHFVLAAKPTFRLLAPTFGTFNVGQTIVIAWSDTNIISGTEISLCYDIDKTPNGNEHWIEIDQVAAANGIGTYSQWDTSNVAPGTYYIGGYLFSGKAIRSYCATPITIVAPKPTFRLTTPTSGTYNVGQTVIVTWAASNMAANATVSLCYDTDTVFNHNEKYFEVDQAPAINSNLSTAGYGAYGWDTTGVKPGTYYIGGYLWSNGKPTWSHLTQPITLVDPTPTFRVTAPTSGSYMPGQNMDIYWIAHNFADGSTVSLFYDKDTVINGNEHYLEVDKVTMSSSEDNQYESYVWAVPSLAPGQYYLGGYIWSNGKATFSHLTQPITITAAPLMVDASTPPSAAASLTAAQLQPIVVEAERRLTAATGIQVAAAMSGVSVQIGNLPADMLGEAAGSSIEISRTAAGYGWFVDPTPSDDSEFSDPLGPYALAAPAASPAANRVDLLTTVMHEMSHILGFGHDDSLDLMNPTLPLGERRLFSEPLSSSLASQTGASSFDSSLAETSAVDQVFASTGDARSWALA
jgi:cyclophilin family peptidyl-prolyl cis-trans isomerase